MANRQMKEKVRKGRLKGRYKARSGSDTQTYHDGSFKQWGTQVVNSGPTNVKVFTGVRYKPTSNPFEEYWNNIFESRKDDDAVLQPRNQVLATLQAMLKDQDINLKIALVNRPSLRVHLFFNIQATRYFLLETDVLHGVVRQSHIYVNKHIARNAYENKQVRWKTVVNIE